MHIKTKESGHVVELVWPIDWSNTWDLTICKQPVLLIVSKYQSGDHYQTSSTNRQLPDHVIQRSQTHYTHIDGTSLMWAATNRSQSDGVKSVDQLSKIEPWVLSIDQVPHLIFTFVFCLSRLSIVGTRHHWDHLIRNNITADLTVGPTTPIGVEFGPMTSYEIAFLNVLPLGIQVQCSCPVRHKYHHYFHEISEPSQPILCLEKNERAGGIESFCDLSQCREWKSHDERCTHESLKNCSNFSCRMLKFASFS